LPEAQTDLAVVVIDDVDPLPAVVGALVERISGRLRCSIGSSIGLGPFSVVTTNHCEPVRRTGELACDHRGSCPSCPTCRSPPTAGAGRWCRADRSERPCSGGHRTDHDQQMVHACDAVKKHSSIVTKRATKIRNETRWISVRGEQEMLRSMGRRLWTTTFSALRSAASILAGHLCSVRNHKRTR